MTSWNGAVSRLPEACCASDPNADVPPPTERLACPPAPRFALPPPLPNIASSRRIFIRSFKSFASAQRWRLHQRGWAEPVQTAWTRCDSAIATTGGHPPASGPARSVTSNSRTAQVKSNETRAGGRGPAIVQQAPSMRAPCSHTPAAPSNTSKRSVRGLFFAHFLLKKRPKNRLRYVTASQ